MCTFFFLAAADKTVQIWETSNGKLINTLTGHAQVEICAGRAAEKCCLHEYVRMR